MYDVVLTAGADKVGECGDSQSVLNKIWDPSYERPLPLGTINMLAMSAVRYMKRYGMTEEDALAFFERETLSAERWAALLHPRHALHAAGLSFEHPLTGKRMEFESPLPQDLRDFLAQA